MKTEVYSWRVSPERKSALQAEAHRHGQSLADLLDRISDEWLGAQKSARADDESEQRRIHTAASAAIGSFASGDPHHSKSVRQLVRQRLIRRQNERNATQRPR